MRWLRGIGALTALGLVIIGAPVALAGWGRMPVGWPAALARPDDGSVLLVALTVLGWLAWAAFTLSIATEAARLVSSGRVRLRIPLLGGLQQLSTGLLLAVLALAPTSPASQAPPRERVVALEEPTRAQVAPEPDEETEGDTYRVAPGDDLWTVSDRLLGDGGRWRELAEANPGKLADPTRPLTPGTRLALPASRAAGPLTVRVHKGDTLSGIALEHLGSAGRWPRIAAANDDLIDDPDHIEIGWRLVVPGAEPAPRSVRPEAQPESQEGAHDEPGEADPPVQDPAPE
ncbi:MAG TPA: LysM peptidoglycan-binding domain-containing protein, partial [Propionicimonas sp.]|nr:LysM peptidoglycan-binding domain-containing protein [Propionicimonas sp.]